MGSLVILYLGGYFTVQIIEQDYDKLYNILLIDSKKNRLEYRSDHKPNFNEGESIYITAKAECQKAFQLHEEDGPNAKWAEGQNWVLDAPSYLCSAIEVNDEKVLKSN
jgi:hypothetical protein